MRTGLQKRFENKEAELAHLKQRVEGLDDPQKTNMMAGIQSRLVAAVNLEKLEDKIAAGDQIKLETNLMMQKFELALLERYQDTHEKMYGFKDEKQTMNIMRRSIGKMLGQYKNKTGPQKINVAAGGLFA